MVEQTKKACDWQGLPVRDDEPEDAVVPMWEITPSLNLDYDGALVRDYRKALDYARAVLDDLMDCSSENEARLGLQLTVRLRDVSKVEEPEG